MKHSSFTGWRTSTYTSDDANCVEVAVGWHKSSYSAANGECIEVTSSDWRKSSYSAANGGCVEVSASEPVVGVRDTKQHGEGPVLEFPMGAWQTFLIDVKTQAAWLLAPNDETRSSPLQPRVATCLSGHARPVVVSRLGR